jgi:hypothetical protein
MTVGLYPNCPRIVNELGIQSTTISLKHLILLKSSSLPLLTLTSSAKLRA